MENNKMRPKVTSSKPPSNGGKGGGLSSLGGRSSFKKVVAENRTRQLQVVTGGRYKYMILSKIITFLKTEFLEVREKRLKLNQLLEKVNEVGLSEDLLKWLAEEALPNHPRIRVVNGQETRYAYEPPLKNCSSHATLFKLLKTRYDNDEGGLLRSLVDDSVPVADRLIKTLIKEDRIIQVQRLDKNEVLFYKPPDPEKCVVDSRFVELWRKVDVCNKEMSHIKTYLKNKKMAVFDDEELEQKARLARKRKLQEEEEEKAAAALKKKRMRRSGQLKNNSHVKDKLMHFDEDGQKLI